MNTRTDLNLGTRIATSVSLLLVGALVGYLVGARRHGMQVAPETAMVELLGGAAPATSQNKRPSRLDSGRSAENGGPYQVTTWEALQRLAESGKNPPWKRRKEWKTVLMSVDPNGFAQIVERIPGLMPREIGDELRHEALRYWGIQDPDNAVLYAQRMTGARAQEDTLLWILQGWAETRPVGAFEWIDGLQAGRLKDMLTTAALPGLAAVAPQEAADRVLALPVSANRKVALGVVVRTVAAQDPVLAVKLTSEFGSERADPDLVGAVADAFARVDLPKSAEWVAQLPESWGKERALQSVVSYWARQDPWQAGEYVLSLTDGDNKRTALTALGSTWATISVEEGLGWGSRSLGQSDSFSVFDSALMAAWAKVSPPDAAEYYGHAAHSGNRDYPLEAIMSEWAATNPADAARWATALQNGRDKEIAVSALVRNWITFDAVQAWGWIRDMPVGGARDLAVDTYMKSVASIDPALAVQAYLEESGRAQN